MGNPRFSWIELVLLFQFTEEKVRIQGDLPEKRQTSHAAGQIELG